jgi:thiol-disulfide isomerase/thioredoxin
MYSIVIAALLAGCAPKTDVDDLKAKVTALEEKVAAMEKSGVKAGPGAAAAAPGADPAQEEAATKLLTEAQEARKNGDFATAKGKIAELTEKYGTTRAGKAATRIGAEINVVGTDAKPLAVEKWFTKKKASYDDAKTTVLVFWEVWCPHCKREVPKLPELAGKWKGKGVQVVALTKITKSATEESVMEFIKENKLEGLPMGKEEGTSMSDAFAVTGIPAAAVVQGGKVVWRGHPAQLTDDVLGKLTGS